jgi:UDP-glucose 4-epimerase
MTTRILVTGGAGFIGSHLVDSLVRNRLDVTVIDNLSAGNLRNLKQNVNAPNFRFIESDLNDSESIRNALQNVEIVYHFAANPEVREVDPGLHFRENQVATFNLLECMRKSGTRTIIFASTSTIYGEASTQPTPENYGPLFPISTYGASKLACEAMITSYAYTCGLRGLILRLGNVVGARSNHGVISDFLKKLKQRPDSLEVLGDGTQSKSYIHISDCILAVEVVVRDFLSSDKRVDAYNVSTSDRVSVRRIAEIVLEEAGANGKVRTTGGVDGGRGWMGDVKLMQLSNQRLRALGWKEHYNSEMAIKQAARELIRQI